MVDDSDWQRLARYYAGECGARERSEIERWIEADPEHRRLAASAAETWKAAGRATRRPYFDVERAWARVSGPIRTRETTTAKRLGLVEAPRSRVASWALPIAAALLLTAGITFLSRGWNRARPTPAVASAAQRTFTTSPGQRSTVDLGDGISVTLGVASTLRTEGGAGQERIVELDGEALFRVRHDERRPFTVRAQGTIVRDIGTTFAVRAYSHAIVGASGVERVRVIVTEGSVAFFPPAMVRDQTPAEVTPVTLRAGQMASLGAADSVTVRDRADVTKFLAWTEGKLVFDDATLAEVAAELERWYGASIRLGSSSIARRHYSATFSGESLDDVLRVLSMSLNLRVDRSPGGSSIVLSDAQ